MLVLPASVSPCETAAKTGAIDSARNWDAQARAGTDAGSLSMSLVTTKEAFAALEDEWNGLFERAGRSTQLFQTFNWLWHWANHFTGPENHAAGELAIVTGWRNGRLVLVCPFVKSQERSIKRLAFMGDPVSQYGDILVESGPHAEADIAAAWAFAVRETRVDLVRLRKVRADAAIAPFLLRSGAIATDPQVAPYVAFEGCTDYAVFEDRYSKNARRNRKRQLRRLHDRGPTTFDRLTHGPATSDEISHAIALKKVWLKERGLVSAALADPRTEAFFRDCVAGGPRHAGVEVAVVRSNGEAAAYEVTVVCKDRIAIHIIAYDHAFEKTGAGSLLMEDSIKRACESGYATFDLLAPAGGYKFDWTDRSLPVADYAVGLTWLGSLYARICLKHLRPAIKHLVEHMPVALRRHLSSAMATLMVVA